MMPAKILEVLLSFTNPAESARPVTVRIIAAANQSGAKILYSEDLQDAITIGPTTIRNPFRV